MPALLAVLAASAAALVLIGRGIHDRNLKRKIENGGD